MFAWNKTALDFFRSTLKKDISMTPLVLLNWRYNFRCNRPVNTVNASINNFKIESSNRANKRR